MMTCGERDIAATVDGIIGLRRREADLLDKLVAGRFTELVSDRMAEAIPLGSLCEHIMVSRSYLSLDMLSDKGVVMVRGKNIAPNRLDDRGIAYVPPEFDDKPLLAGDILVRQTGQPGVACVVPLEYAGGFVSSALILRLKDDCAADAEYICRYINSSFGKRYLSTCPKHYLSAETLASMPIVILPYEMRDFLLRLWRKVAELKDIIQKEQEKLMLLRDALLASPRD